MADYNSDRTGSNIDLTLDKVDALDAKVQPTSTGIDVTGTVTADGLTVGAGKKLYTEANPSVTNSRNWFIRNDDSAFGDLGIKVSTSNSTEPTKRALNISKDGDVSFYEDTGTTAKMVWDASAESLGIGTASPSLSSFTASATGLHLKGAAPALRLEDTSGENTYIAQLNENLYISNQATNGVIRLLTNNTERARIDSSGNLLVGTTSTTVGYDSADSGIALRGQSGSLFSRSNSFAISANRNGTDGDIVEFHKDGSTVGSIGTTVGALDIKNAVAGGVAVTYENSTNGLLVPIDTTGAFADGLHNLGRSNARFKDLYLSGGVYLGGTGAANKLDDYETGSWTPSYIGTTTNPTVTYNNLRDGRYTKVGNLVIATFIISTDSVSGGSGNLNVSGLPFTVVATTKYNAGAVSIAEIGGFAATPPLSGRPRQGSTIISLQYRSSITATSESPVPVSALNAGANSNVLSATITYYTTDS